MLWNIIWLNQRIAYFSRKNMKHIWKLIFLWYIDHSFSYNPFIVGRFTKEAKENTNAGSRSIERRKCVFVAFEWLMSLFFPMKTKSRLNFVMVTWYAVSRTFCFHNVLLGRKWRSNAFIKWKHKLKNLFCFGSQTRFQWFFYNEIYHPGTQFHFTEYK